MPRGPRMDWEKMRKALAGPGSDTRVWIAIARVDDDPDAIRLDPALGWIADVTVQGGPLDQEGPIACRVGQGGEGALVPINRNDEVLVTFTEGDANAGPVITARLQNEENPIPSTVNGAPITELLAAVNYILQSAVNGAQVDLGGAMQVQALLLQLMSPTFVMLGGSPTAPPTQPIIKGLEFVTALSTFEQVLYAWAVQVTGVLTYIATSYVPAGLPVPPVQLAALAASAGAYTAALTAFGTQAATSLSTKVLTE